MKAETKIMHQRLEALKLAEKLGNVSRVCRERGISTAQFYEYRKRFREQGFEGLRDLPSIHKTHPQTTAPEVEKRNLELVEENPQKGCGHIEQLLKLEGKNCSKPTIQKIMERHGLGSCYQRFLKQEAQHLIQGKQLSEEQIISIEKANPCFKERHVESKAACFVRTPSMRANSRKWEKSTCKQPSTPMALLCSVTCTRASCPIMRHSSFITTYSPSMRSMDCR